MDEFIFNDYAGWIIENESLIKQLKEKESEIYEHFENVFLVVNHLYNLKVEDEPFNDDYFKIFSIGFNYLFNQFESIKLLLETNYDGNINHLMTFDKSIVLFLMANEFQDDIYDSMNEQASDIVKPIKEIENEIYTYITNKEHVPKEIFEKLDHVTLEIYTKYEQIFHPVYSIFYDIAEELLLV